MNVRQAWLNSDSIRDCWMSNEFVKMQFILHEQNIKIIPVYIRSAQHLHADLISRNKVMPDCHLDGSIAQKIFQLLGQYEVTSRPPLTPTRPRYTSPPIRTTRPLLYTPPQRTGADSGWPISFHP